MKPSPQRRLSISRRGWLLGAAVKGCKPIQGDTWAAAFPTVRTPPSWKRSLKETFNDFESFFQSPIYLYCFATTYDGTKLADTRAPSSGAQAAEPRLGRRCRAVWYAQHGSTGMSGSLLAKAESANRGDLPCLGQLLTRQHPSAQISRHKAFGDNSSHSLKNQFPIGRQF